jgi:hypothetical protein
LYYETWIHLEDKLNQRMLYLNAEINCFDVAERQGDRIWGIFAY